MRSPPSSLGSSTLPVSRSSTGTTARGRPATASSSASSKSLSEWLRDTYSVKTYQPPYFIEKGGVFLKDTAVLAGLGCIGKNNIVVTPEYGPRIRWRTLLLDRTAKPTGRLHFDPCDGCPQPCRKACPVGAFDRTVYSSSALGQSIPARHQRDV